MQTENTESSPQIEISALVELVACHCEWNLKCVGKILEAVAYLGGPNPPDLIDEVLRARVAHVCVDLTRFAHELAIANLGCDETQAALKRSQCPPGAAHIA